MPSAEAYRDFKARGLCVDCGKADAAPGRVYCDQCRARRQSWYAALKASGRCVACGQPRAGGTATRCPDCAHKHKIRDVRRQRRLAGEGA